MIKLSAKIISSIVGLAVVGTVTATAAVANSHNDIQPANSSKVEEVLPSSQISSQPVSSAINSRPASTADKSPSATISSKGTVSTVADGVNEIKQATDNGVSRIQKAADDGVSAVKQGQDKSKVTITNVYYNVINPKTGMLIGHDDPNYEKYKAELGGDAGTVPTTKSTACQAALKKLHDEYEAKKVSSTPIGGNVARQVPYK